jgi:hypothetical protein
MKDAYYFPHDSNAKDDPKCIQLIEELGLEGYGIFWVLIETLRSQTDYMAPLTILTGLARRYNTTADKMKNVVLKYGLFKITEDDMFFFSEAFTKRMEAIDDRRKRLSEAGKRGNKIRWESPPDNKAIATQSQVNKRKVKESKSVTHTSEDIYVDEIESSRRDDEIMKQLSTSVIPDDKKEIYLKRLKANSYLKNIKGDKYKIKLDSIRAEAEYLYSMGYLNPTKPKSEENTQYKTIGGYWNE